MESKPHVREAAHPTPLTYAKVAVILAVVTGVEVWIFYIEALENVLLPMFIVLSAFKFVLVAMFYMHLKFESRLFSGLFAGGLVLALGVILALMALFEAFGTSDSASVEVAAGVVDQTTATTTEDSVTGDTVVPPPTHEVGSVSSDTYKFNKESLTASAGQEVVLEFKNNAITQQHNWVLVTDGNKDAVAADGLAAGPNNNWVPPGDERVIAHTELLNPGETGEVRLTAPMPGTYQFVCTFPGHNLTMFGTFEVTP